MFRSMTLQLLILNMSLNRHLTKYSKALYMTMAKFFYLLTSYSVLYGVPLLPTQELALFVYRIEDFLACLVLLDMQQVVSQL